MVLTDVKTFDVTTFLGSPPLLSGCGTAANELLESKHFIELDRFLSMSRLPAAISLFPPDLSAS